MSHHSFETILVVNDHDIKAEVEVDFQPAEPMTRNYPGCKAEVSITSVVIDGEEAPYWLINAFSLQLENDAFDAIAQQRESEVTDYADYLYQQKKERRYAA